MSKKKAAIVASAALAASTLFIVAQPASGALVTTCRGAAGAVTVPGDLIVPRGADCSLVGTTVTGNVKVDANADLLLEGATIGGEVYVTRNGYVDVIAGTSIAGAVRGRDAFAVFIEESTVGGSILQSSPNTTVTEPFVYLYSVGVGGGLDSSAGEVLIESTEIAGAVSARNGEYADIIDSVLGAGLTVRNNLFGGVVCESEIYGDSLYRGNKATLQIGGSGEVGPCDGASYWGGNVTFTNNTATETGFDISNNIVAGDLAGSGNTPLPTGAGNRVRGEITLEFAAAEDAQMSLQSQSEASRVAAAEAEVVVDARAADIKVRAADRRAEALAEAAEAPAGQALSPVPAG